MAEKPTDRAAAIRTWIMKNPRPALLRVYSLDGKEWDVEIKPGAAWSDTAVSIAALEPVRLEAMAPDSKLLRACVVSDLVAKEEQAAANAHASFVAMQSTDPETQRLIALATLVANAHERATDAIRETVGVAFAKMQEICDSLAQQANASTATANELTVAIRNLLIQQAQEAADLIHDKEESPLEKLASNFMAGQAMADAEKAAAPTKPNGKH